MSFFAVTIEEITELRPHPNADRLLLGRLKGIGFQFILPKDRWQEGDRCLYFPIDSILPQKILAVLGLEGKLAGAQKNRVKTIKLRGEISQGLIGPLSLLAGLPDSERTPQKITEFLGVSRYEPEIELPISRDANLVELPPGVGIYDIENCERYPGAVADLMASPVWISEKLEGSHFALAIIEGREWICQRRFAIEPKPDAPAHFFWQVAQDRGVIELARKFYRDLNATHLVLRGEILGPNIQSNIYRLQEREIKFYDLQANHNYLDVDSLHQLFERYDASDKLVPTLAKGATLASWLAGTPLPQAAIGPSLLFNTGREGIVIRPMQNRSHPDLGGRLILKQLSPEYLANQK